MAGFTKLFSDIIDSTIWREDMPTKVVWITMLAKADKHGIVRSSIPGLADAARVSLQDCQSALEKFLGPDEWSRTKDFEGRRIMETDGGWILLNYAKYRKVRDEDETRIATNERVRRFREKNNVTNVTVVTPSNAIAEAEAEAEAEATRDIPPMPSAPAKRKRVSRIEKLQAFSNETKHVVETLLPLWPSEGTEAKTSPTDLGLFCQRVSDILGKGNDPELLIESAQAYFKTTRKKYAAPQFFFGLKGFDGGDAPYVGFVRLILTKREHANNPA